MLLFFLILMRFVFRVLVDINPAIEVLLMILTSVLKLIVRFCLIQSLYKLEEQSLVAVLAFIRSMSTFSCC